MLQALPRGDSGGGSLSLARLIDTYGEALLADLRRFYGIDLVETIEGSGTSPVLVLRYVEALPDTSLTHAFQRGGWEHYGWGQDRLIAVDLFDALTFNTEATGHWSKPPKLGRYPRPKPKSTPSDDASADEPKKRVSVKELWGRIKSQQGR